MAPQQEWFEKDYYAVLGVPPDADAKTITKAYRKLARQYHPDVNKDPGAEERFKEISAAYDVIGDPAKRAEYDEVRRLVATGGFGAAPGGAGGRRTTFTFEDLGDLGDLFGGLFGRGRRSGPRGTGPRRGADLEAELHLSFEDAVRGVTTTVNLMSEAPCATCGGSGARPGTRPERCRQCGGTGFVGEEQGLFSFSRPCPACGGRGTTISDPCPSCGGSGVQVRPRSVKVRIPPGVEDGQRIRIKGRGAPGRNGGPPGDLYVTVHVSPHRLFGRRGRDLTLRVPVTYPEAVLGARITVPTLEGGSVTLKVPPGTPSGRTFRVRGKGIPRRDGSAGDLLVTVEVDVPRHLTAAQREAVERLAAVLDRNPREGLFETAAAGAASGAGS